MFNGVDMQRVKICFYVPVEDCERVKAALFAAGAGHIGAYDCCAWQTLGEGQFRPLAGSHPSVGKLNVIEKIAEMKVEMICAQACIQKVVAALKSTHPYEEPAYEVWELADY